MPWRQWRSRNDFFCSLKFTATFWFFSLISDFQSLIYQLFTTKRQQVYGHISVFPLYCVSQRYQGTNGRKSFNFFLFGFLSFSVFEWIFSIFWRLTVNQFLSPFEAFHPASFWEYSKPYPLLPRARRRQFVWGDKFVPWSSFQKRQTIGSTAKFGLQGNLPNLKCA